MMLVVNDMLPEYHTRHKKKIFMENYQKISKISSTALNQIYQELAGENCKKLNKLLEKQQEDFVETLASHEEQHLVQDMKYFNDKEGSTVLTNFGTK